MPLTYVDFNMNFLLTKTPNSCKNLIKFVDLMSCSKTKKNNSFPCSWDQTVVENYSIESSF